MFNTYFLVSVVILHLMPLVIYIYLSMMFSLQQMVSTVTVYISYVLKGFSKLHVQERHTPTARAWVTFLHLASHLGCVCCCNCCPFFEGFAQAPQVFLPPLKPTFKILVMLGNNGHEEPPHEMSTAKSP